MFLLLSRSVVIHLVIMLFGMVALCLPSTVAAQEGFEATLDEIIAPVQGNINAALPGAGSGPEGVRDGVLYLVQTIGIPILIAVGVLLAIIGFYKLFFGDSEEDIAKGSKWILWGVVGIVLMISARYLVYTFVGESGTEGFLRDGISGDVVGVELAQNAYDLLLFPFLKIAMFLVIGVLFVMLVGKLFGFLFATDDSARKKAGTIVVWNTVGILLIIAAQQIVEAVYGRRDEVINSDATNLADIGSSVLEVRSIPIVYDIINWVLGLTSLVILIIIVFQAFQLLTKPDDSDKLAKIGKSLGFIFGGIVVIGAAYLVVNVLLVQ